MCRPFCLFCFFFFFLFSSESLSSSQRPRFFGSDSGIATDSRDVDCSSLASFSRFASASSSDKT